MSPGAVFDVSQLVKLETDLGKVAGATVSAITAAVTQSGEGLKAGWVANAAATSGAHGVHYPSSITAEMKPGFGSIGVEVGPDSSKPQGVMGRGFEYGSVNQPPHMDGHKAADVEEPKFVAAIAAAAGKALGSL